MKAFEKLWLINHHSKRSCLSSLSLCSSIYASAWPTLSASISSTLSFSTVLKDFTISNRLYSFSERSDYLSSRSLMSWLSRLAWALTKRTRSMLPGANLPIALVISGDTRSLNRSPVCRKVGACLDTRVKTSKSLIFCYRAWLDERIAVKLGKSS